MTATDTPSRPETMQRAARTRAETLSQIRKIWPWIFLALMVVIFTVAARVMNNTNFLNASGIQSILVYCTQILLLALGETVIIIAAGIDLSVGYQLGLSSVVGASIMQVLFAHSWNPILTITLGMLGGTLVCIVPGWINGALVARVKVPPFIATLGVGWAAFGTALLISGGYPVAQQPPYLGQIGNGYLLYVWPGHGVSFFTRHAMATPADLVSITPLIPNVVLITIVVTLVCWFILSKTQFGQHVFAIGGGYEASMRAGIPVRRALIRVYVIAGILAGIAGVLWASRFSSGAANAGVDTTLMSIAAVVIGGASLFGGEGSIVGTIVGALTIATIQFGLVVLGLKPFYQYIVIGVVVIVAVIVDQFGRTLK